MDHFRRKELLANLLHRQQIVRLDSVQKRGPWREGRFFHRVARLVPFVVILESLVRLVALKRTEFERFAREEFGLQVQVPQVAVFIFRGDPVFYFRAVEPRVGQSSAVGG